MSLRVACLGFALATVTAFAAGCSHEVADHEADVDGQDDALSDVKTSLPTAASLAELPVSVSGMPLFASNNPETITGLGILSAIKLPAALAGTSRVDPASYHAAQLPFALEDAPTADVVGSQSLDARCPNGGVKEMGVYVAHIMAVKGAYVGFGVVADADATVSVEGQLASGAWSQLRDPGFVSAASVRNVMLGTPAARSVKIAKGVYTQLSSVQETGGYIDGRLRVRVVSGNGCLFPYTVAQSTPTLSALPNALARGNVAWKGWYGGAGEGRVSGMYAGDTLTGKAPVRLDGVGSSKGVMLATLGQSVAAKVRLGDGSEVDFGNYGALYHATLDVTNGGNACVDAVTELVAYGSVKGNDAPSYGFFRRGIANRTLYIPQVTYNGPFVAEIGSTRVKTPGSAVLYFRDVPGAADNLGVASLRQVVARTRLAGGKTESVTVHVPIPGMATAPLGLVVTGVPCR